MSDESAPIVILLHGALRTRVSLFSMERALRKAGFETWNRSYAWRGKTLEEIAEGLAAQLERFREREMHLVTHSYGAIVARVYLARHRPANARRMVNLAPPHRGAQLAQKGIAHPALKRIFESIYGKAGPNLLPAQIRKIPAPRCEFAVIAGGRGQPRGYSPLLDGDNDGILRVAETKLPGMKAFALVPHSHTFLMNGRDTIAMTIRFLREGRF